MDNERIEFFKNSDFKGIPCESACDFSLPDYKGEVRKVLYTGVKAIPSGKFSDGNEITASGIVTYNIIYLNGENKIEGAEFNSDYDFTYKCQSENPEDITVNTKISSYSVRLTGPRRFSAKCSLTSDICVLDMCSLESDLEGHMSDAELKRESVLVMMRRSYPSGEREYAEKLISLDGVIADDVNIISKDSSVAVTSVTRSGSEAVIKGNIGVDILLSVSDVPAYSEHKTIPFEEAVPIADGGELVYLNARGRVTSLALNVNAEDFSTDIVANIIAEFEVLGAENSEVVLASDGYLLSCASEPLYEKLTYTELAGVQSSDERLEVRIPVSEIGVTSPREMICVGADVRSTDARMSQRGVDIDAEIRLSGIICVAEESGEIGYAGFKYSAPVSLNVNVSCQNQSNTVPNVQISLSDVSAVIDRDAVVVSLNAHAEAELTSSKTTSRLVSMNSNEDVKFEKCASRITVYYPEAGEDVFSVAKKFHTTVREIAVNNALTESVLNPSDGAVAHLGRLIIR